MTKYNKIKVLILGLCTFNVIRAGEGSIGTASRAWQVNIFGLFPPFTIMKAFFRNKLKMIAIAIMKGEKTKDVGGYQNVQQSLGRIRGPTVLKHMEEILAGKIVRVDESYPVVMARFMLGLGVNGKPDPKFAKKVEGIADRYPNFTYSLRQFANKGVPTHPAIAKEIEKVCLRGTEHFLLSDESEEHFLLFDESETKPEK